MHQTQGPGPGIHLGVVGLELHSGAKFTIFSVVCCKQVCRVVILIGQLNPLMTIYGHSQAV